jgi:hypothetical protein
MRRGGLWGPSRGRIHRRLGGRGRAGIQESLVLGRVQEWRGGGSHILGSRQLLKCRRSVFFLRRGSVKEVTSGDNNSVRNRNQTSTKIVR